jgi:hypothetical protein
MTTLKAALDYAACGWLVIPLNNPKQGVCSCRKKGCSSPGKHPRTEHGLNDGSKDPKQIARWWEKWPDANLGILTGQESGLLVLDVDGVDGKASLQALTAAHGSLPPTLCSKTGRKGTDGKRAGCHYYFRAPVGVAIRNSAGTLGKGLDIRADGGYVVAPPSLHPSGLLYEWLAPEPPLADVPPWMLAKLTGAKPAPEAPRAQGEAVAEGGRNAALTSLAGTMRRAGMTPEAIEAGLIETNKSYLPPLPASEVRSIARSVARYEPAAPVRAVDPPVQTVASQPPRQLPAPLAAAAFYGLAGEFVRLVGPQTEADPAALLFQFLAAMGSIIGRGPHYRVGAAKHFANLFMVIVGNSAKARKGTSWSEVKSACKLIDIRWWNTRITDGLSTGEGLIHAVRDEIKESVPIKDKERRVIDHQEQVTDPGEADKRLLCVESELGRALQAAARDGNTLSPVIRLAWDGDALRVLTKNARETCAEPHISIIGHITNTELQKLLSESDAANGFANRFLWVCSTRSQYLAFGGKVDAAALSLFCARARAAVDFARAVQEVAWAPDAAQRWEDVYPQLSEGKLGLFGQVTARAEAQAIRLALMCALLDKSAEIRLEHLEAALELWRYCFDSAAFIFGHSLGNPLADAILELLRAHPDGMTRTELHNHFGRNKKKAALDAAIAVAQRNGSLRSERQETGGRAAEVLHFISV